MKLCEILTGYRLRRQLTRTAFAKKTGLSASYLRTLEIEGGPDGKKPRPTLASLEKLAAAMKTTVQELIRELDPEERAYFNLPVQEASILERAERELPAAQRELLEKIALEFFKALPPVKVPARQPIFSEIEASLPPRPYASRLSDVYGNSVNVFTDASFYAAPGETSSDRFTAAVIVTKNTSVLSGNVYAGRTGLGQKGAEEFAVWLGLLEALKARKPGEGINLFTDSSGFSQLMGLVVMHSKNGSPLKKFPSKKNFKTYAFGLATHLVEKSLEENIRFLVWSVKGHLSPNSVSGISKQMEAFARQNNCAVDADTAKLLCTYNGMADQKAREFRIKMAEKEDARWNVLPKEAYTPRTLTDEQWMHFHQLSTSGPLSK